MDKQAAQFFDLQAGSFASLKQHWGRIIKTEMTGANTELFFQKLFASIFLSYQSVTGNDYGSGSIEFAADVIAAIGSERLNSSSTQGHAQKLSYLKATRQMPGVYTNQDDTKNVIKYLSISCMEYEQTTGNETGTFFIEVIIGFLVLLVGSESLGQRKDALAITFLREMINGLTGNNGAPEDMINFVTANRNRLLQKQEKFPSKYDIDVNAQRRDEIVSNYSSGNASRTPRVSQFGSNSSSNKLSINNLNAEGLKDRRWTLLQHSLNAKSSANIMSAIWFFSGIAVPIWTAYHSQTIGVVSGVAMPFLGIAASGMFFNGMKIGSFLTFLLAIWFGRFGFYGTKESIAYLATGAVVFWFTTRYVPRIESETLTTVKQINELLESQ
jgi:hypothetical protein